MARRLLQSNAHNSPEHLIEVVSLLKEVREAWVAIPQDHRTIPQPTSASALATTGAQ
jgi:flagellin-specific chaperone FliS